MNEITLLGTLFLGITSIGFYFAYLYGRKTKKFRWSEYYAIIILPVLCILFFSFYYDSKLLILFFVSSAVGFISEYVIGLVYHKTLNKRLWHYDRLSLNGYTSLLSIPLWGVAGIIFWFLSKFVGL